MPFGYICGFPVGGISSELYGYYAGQLAMQSQQGSAVKEAVATWSIEHGQVCHFPCALLRPTCGKIMLTGVGACPAESSVTVALVACSSAGCIGRGLIAREARR